MPRSIAEVVAGLKDRQLRLIFEQLLSRGISDNMLVEDYATSDELDSAIADLSSVYQPLDSNLTELATGSSISQNYYPKGNATGGLGNSSSYDDGTSIVTICTNLKLGGTTSSYPMLKRSSTDVHFRKADDSAYGGWVSQTGHLRGSGIASGKARFYDTTDTYYIELSANPAGSFSWSQTLPDKAGIVGVATNGALTTPTAAAIPIADGSNKLAAGWISEVLAVSDLSDSTGKTGSSAKLVSASAAGSTGAIPMWSSSDLGSSGFTESGTDWSTSSILTITGAATGLTIRAADKLYMKITGGSGMAAGFQDSLGNSPISIADQQFAAMSYGGRSIKCNYAGTMQFDGVTGSQNYFTRWSANGVPVDGGLSDDGSTIGVTRSTIVGPGSSTLTFKSSASQNLDIQAGSSGILYLRNSAGTRVFGIDGSGNVLWGVTQGTSGTLMRFDAIGAAADSGITDSGSVLTLTRDTTVSAGKKLTCTGNETEAGLNIGQLGGNPSSPDNGDVWGLSGANQPKYRKNGSTVAIETQDNKDVASGYCGLDANARVTSTKLQMSATDKIVGRSTAGAGASEEIACTASGRDFLALNVVQGDMAVGNGTGDWSILSKPSVPSLLRHDGGSTSPTWGSEVEVVKTGNTTTSSTTYADDPHLSISIAASTSYCVQLDFMVDINATSDFKFQFSYSGSVTTWNEWYTVIDENDVSSAAVNTSIGSRVIVIGANAKNTVMLRAYLLTNAAGTLKVQWGLNSGTNTATIYAGGRLTARKTG